ncbi:MAG: hypothetical protein ACJAW4_001992 [Paracoccaceae bacterium]|jgi:hypothetical protein
MLQCGMTPLRVALLAVLPLAGCGAGGAVSGGYDLPVTADAPSGDWPRLADVTFPTVAPDPATGAAVIASLSIAAATSAARADALTAPVMTEAEANRLRTAGRRSR